MLFPPLYRAAHGYLRDAKLIGRTANTFIAADPQECVQSNEGERIFMMRSMTLCYRT